jgi:ABC-type transport system involved in multi-copper enzyme maturation permease subunit
MRAELRRLLRWPATWVLGGTWLALNLTFGYILQYLSYRGVDGASFGAAATRQALLAQMMPDQVPLTLVQGLPMFGGALLLILGGLAIGSGYGWGTWKTVFTVGPRRRMVVGGTVIAMGLIVAVLVLATFVLDLTASFVVATAVDGSTSLPGPVAVLTGLGSALAIGGMWTCAGVLLGTLARGPALAVGLGLVWSLVVENLLRGVASLLGPLKAFTDVLPGTAAGSLAGALGAAPQSDPAGTPGVLTTLGGTTAIALLLAYIAAFVVASLVLTSRRDLAG